MLCIAMGTYYRKHLLGPDLKRVYELASPRIRQYLEAEVLHVIERVRGAGRVLELGSGYGRVLAKVASHVGRAVGVDVSRPNLEFGVGFLRDFVNCDLLRMNAVRLAFKDAAFDATFCIQNGISAFRVDRHQLIAEALRVTRPGGNVLFSTYSPRIWTDRLDWFRSQSRAGLLGELDETLSVNGVIICKDGFRSTTVADEELHTLFAEAGQSARISEVDESSVFAEVVKEP